MEDKDNENCPLINEEKKICGKIYITVKGRILVFCNLCASEFYGFGSYEDHLRILHKNMSQFFEKTSENTKVCSKSLLFQEEALMEEEIPIAQLKSKADTSRRNDCFENKTSLNDSKSRTPEGNLNTNRISGNEYLKYKSEDDLMLPKDIRNVKKRIYRKQTETTIKLENENRKHKCPICGTAFKERSNLTHHTKRHSEEKKHQCPQCDKKFYTTSELKTHMYCHKGERDFLCSDCGLAFARKAHLLRHAKRHTNRRDYKCPNCEKAFFNSAILARHMKSHSSERPISCKHCPATFPYKTSLSNHMKLHENKREYKCLICARGFNQKAGLFSHLKIVHKAS